MIASLLRPTAYDHPVDAPQLIETHISWVLLTGPFAYKLKKPVDLGFVDFTTVERRHFFCLEEVRLNQRLAPELYLGVVPVHGPVAEARFGGPGPVLDWAVRMRQFSQESLLATAMAAGRIEPRHWHSLADSLAAFQATAAVTGTGETAEDSGFGSPASIEAAAWANLEALERCTAAHPALPDLQRWTSAAATALAPVFAARRQAGRVREGHGDLHLGNMILLEDRIVVFDCLEFSPELRWIDVLSELAFLAMDLTEHGRSIEAASFLDRWLDRTGDYTGLAVWRWYIVYRALVRAKVTALRLTQPGLEKSAKVTLETSLRTYLTFASTTVSAPPGQLVITCGVSGSGKSHLSRLVCARLGWLHLRSDAERKRLFGIWGGGTTVQEHHGPDLYSSEVSDRLYHEILPGQAAAALLAGFSVIVDATFLQRRHRQAMAAVAQRCGARFRILHCSAKPEIAHARIAHRQSLGGDPSDADAAVLDSQWHALEPLEADEIAAAVLSDHGEDLESIIAQLR